MAGASQLLPIKSCTTESVYPTHSARFCWVEELKKKKNNTYFVLYLESVLLGFWGTESKTNKTLSVESNGKWPGTLSWGISLFSVYGMGVKASRQTGSSSRGRSGGDGGYLGEMEKKDCEREMRTFARSQGAKIQLVFCRLSFILLYL